MSDGFQISDKAFEQFFSDMRDHLQDLEDALLECERTPDCPEGVARIFRAIHTIKGTAGMFGFSRISELSHHVEDLFALVRGGRVAITSELVGHTLAVHDLIARMLRSLPVDEDEITAQIETFRRLLPAGRLPAAPAPLPPAAPLAATPVTYGIHFRFAADKKVLAHATNPRVYLNALCELGSARITPLVESVPELERLDPEVCHVHWQVFLTTEVSIEEIRNEFMFIEDDLSELRIEAQVPPATPPPAEPLPRVLIDAASSRKRFQWKRDLCKAARADMVTHSGDALEMIRMALSEERPYCLALVGVLDPFQDGLELLGQVRTLERERGIPREKRLFLALLAESEAVLSKMHSFHLGERATAIKQPVGSDCLLSLLSAAIVR